MEEGYTTQQVAHAIEANERNLRFWTGPNGVMTPDIANPGRRRTPKLFSLRNVFEAAVVQVLARRGIELKVIRSAIQEMAKYKLLKTLEGDNTVILIFVPNPDPHAGWYLFPSIDPPREDGLPQAALQFLGKHIAGAEECIVLNLSKIKKRIMARV